MKFAHNFQQTLERENFPSRWVEQAIPYGQLKKCLKQIQRELDAFGLDPETLRQLRDCDPTSDPSSPVGLKYRLLQDAGNGSHVRPSLTVNIRVRDGIAIDASLSPASKRVLERIALKQAESPAVTPITSLSEPEILPGTGDSLDSSATAPVETV
jgi:E3 ubiquitin-protein ligase BAH